MMYTAILITFTNNSYYLQYCVSCFTINNFTMVQQNKGDSILFNAVCYGPKLKTMM